MKGSGDIGHSRPFAQVAGAQEELLLSQFWTARQAATEVQVLVEIFHTENVIVEKSLIFGKIFLHIQPLSQMFFIGEVLSSHIPRVAAIRNLTDCIHAEKRDHGLAPDRLEKSHGGRNVRR